MERECKGCGAILQNDGKCPYCGRRYEIDEKMDSIQKIKKRGYYAGDINSAINIANQLNGINRKSSVHKGNIIILITVLSVIVMLFFALIIFSAKRSIDNKSAYKSNNAYSYYNEYYTEYDDELSKANENYIYSAGEYEVGKDMPAGEYVILGRGIANGSGCVNIYEDAGMTKESIGYSSLSWFDHNTIIVVKEGQWVDISHGIAYYSDKVDIELNPYSHSGMFKVGRDVAVGKYKLVQNEKESQYGGNYEIYSAITENGPVIKDSGRFETKNGGAEIELSEGDYLYTKFCHVEKNE